MQKLFEKSSSGPALCRCPACERGDKVKLLYLFALIVAITGAIAGTPAVKLLSELTGFSKELVMAVSLFLFLLACLAFALRAVLLKMKSQL